jgi:hypothetical protein
MYSLTITLTSESYNSDSDIQISGKTENLSDQTPSLFGSKMWTEVTGG